MTDDPIDDEALVAHLEWVRSLAERLVGDADLADDLRQEVALSVLASDTGGVQAFRAWLATVSRNAVRQWARRESQRREVERIGARDEAVDEQRVERARLHSDVAQAVLDLREPYRTAILMRYSEQRTPMEIALELGVPLPTVKTRLRRGLDQLRERFGATDERRRRVFAAGAWAWGGAAVALVTLVAVVVSVRSTGSDGLAPVEPAPVLGVARADRAATVESPRIGAAAERREIAPPVSTDGAPTILLARGVALDLDGRPAQGLNLTFRTDVEHDGDPQRFESDAAGRFTFDGLASHGRIDVESEAWVQVGTPRVFPDAAGEEHVVLVARPTSVRGRVTDTGGTPIENAEVRYQFTDDFRLGIEAPVDRTALARWETTSGPDGEFVLDRVPARAGAILWVGRAGFEVARVPASDAGPVDVVLARADPARTIVGVVVDDSGRPFRGAWVSADGVMGRTASDGHFQVHVAPGTTSAEVTAALRGGAPATATWTSGDAPMTLVVEGPCATIDGVVVDARGRPLAGVRVRPLDVTPFGSLPRRVSGATEWRPASLERACGRDREVLGDVTDADGRFVVDGLQDRAYRLLVVDPSTLARTVTAPHRAGARALRVELAREREAARRVAGRVVDANGAPIVNARVTARRPLDDATSIEGEDELDGNATVMTDSQGRFAWDALVTDGLVIDVSAPPRFVDVSIALEDREAHGELVLTLTPRRRIRVTIPDVGLADSFQVLAADGARTRITLASGSTVRAFDRGGFHGTTRSHDYGTGADAAWVVLLRDDVEVERRRIEWSERPLTVVRF